MRWFLSVIVLSGIGWYWYLIINFLSRPQCMTTLHWFNDWSSNKWACWEFLGFIIGWLCKVPFCLSFYGLANWLIWPYSLCIVCMRDLGSSCTFPYFSQNQSFSFQAKDSERRAVELGWENFVDNVKNCWENCEGDLESWLIIGRIIGMMEVACMVWPWVVIILLAP